MCTETIDAREIDSPPFAIISDALDTLENGEQLQLINSFEPVPLYDVLDERGFEYTTTTEGEDWHVLIQHTSNQ